MFQVAYAIQPSVENFQCVRMGRFLLEKRGTYFGTVKRNGFYWNGCGIAPNGRRTEGSSESAMTRVTSSGDYCCRISSGRN